MNRFIVRLCEQLWPARASRAAPCSTRRRPGSTSSGWSSRPWSAATSCRSRRARTRANRETQSTPQWQVQTKKLSVGKQRFSFSTKKLFTYFISVIYTFFSDDKHLGSLFSHQSMNLNRTEIQKLWSVLKKENLVLALTFCLQLLVWQIKPKINLH